MLPGHIGGVYSQEETHLDLLRLAKFGRLRFVAGEVEKIDFRTRKIHFRQGGSYLDGAASTEPSDLLFTTSDATKDTSNMRAEDVIYSCGGRSVSSSSTKYPDPQRPPMNYDVLSVNVGSMPSFEGTQISAATAQQFNITPVKPIDELSKTWEHLLRAEDFGASKQKRIICIVGGGAAGVEMAFAIHARLNGRAKEKKVKISLLVSLAFAHYMRTRIRLDGKIY